MLCKKVDSRLKCISNTTISSIHQPGWYYLWFKCSLRQDVDSWQCEKWAPLHHMSSPVRESKCLRQPSGVTTEEGCFPGSTSYGKKKHLSSQASLICHTLFIDTSEQLEHCCKLKLLTPSCKFYCHKWGPREALLTLLATGGSLIMSHL